MMVILLIIFVLSVCIGCSRSTIEENNQESDYAVLMAKVIQDEGNVLDLNTYIFNVNTGVCSGHNYVSGSLTESLKLPYGQYEIFVIGNCGKDLGNMSSVSDIQELKFSLSEDNNKLPLFGSSSLLLTQDESCEIELKQCSAKIKFSINISDNLPDMILQSVQLKNVAMTGYYNSPTSCEDQRTSTSLVEMSSRSYDTTIYIAENCAGVNTAITNQDGKNLENAPDGATYIQINAISGNRFFNYCVFLGENNTTDFNVKKGSSHELNITIKGENEVDTRMKSESVEITDNMIDHRFSSQYVFPGNNYKVFITPSSKQQTITFELLQGDPRYFTSPSSVTLEKNSPDTSFTIGYNLPVVSASTSELRYKVTIRTSEGNVYSKEFSRKFCNLLSIENPKEGGTLDRTYGTGIKYFRGDSIFIITQDSVQTLKASCYDGYALQGWYDNTSRIITQNELYKHPFKSSSENISMIFKQEKVYIYTNLSTVNLQCLKKEPIIDKSKNAYIVDTNVYCEVSSEKEVIGWYDENGNLVSSDAIYGFTSKKNRSIYPKFRQNE